MRTAADEVLMNMRGEETFPTLTRDFTLPFIVKDNRFTTSINLIIASCFLLFQSRLTYMVFLTPNNSKFNLTLNLVIFLGILLITLYHFLKFIRPKVAIIKADGIFVRVPIYDLFNFLLGKMQFIGFDKIYESYYSEFKSRIKFSYFLNLLYVKNSINQDDKERYSVEIGQSEKEVKQIVAITRTAMLNYHQKHNITKLPKVKFIQQR